MIGQGVKTDDEGSSLPHLSTHAMNGLDDFRCMRVTVSVKGNAIHAR